MFPSTMDAVAILPRVVMLILHRPLAVQIVAKAFCMYSALAKVVYGSWSFKAPEKVLFSHIKALTFYQGRMTMARRTPPVPQLSCMGDLCGKNQPSVVQCTSRGDGQWKCEAELPSNIRFGPVDVSCEGWKHPDDEYVLKGSCALRYELLPTGGPYQSSWVDFTFKCLFWAIFGFITLMFVLSFFRPVEDDQSPPGGGPGPDEPPPPYQKVVPSVQQSTPSTQPTSSSSSSWAGGLASGLGLGALAGALLGPRRRGEQPRMWGPGYGTLDRDGYHGVYDTMHSNYGRSDQPGASGTHTSTGFGGTSNR